MCYVEHLVYLAEYFFLLNHNFVLPRLDFVKVGGVNISRFIGAFAYLVNISQYKINANSKSMKKRAIKAVYLKMKQKHNAVSIKLRYVFMCLCIISQKVNKI